MLYSVTPRSIPRDHSVRTLLPIIFLYCCSAHGGEDVEVADAWMRAMPPGQSNSAAYMRLINHTGESRKLVAVSSPLARAVEIHESRLVDGRWRMRALEDLTLEGGAEVDLSPGGIHLMVLGLADSPQVGAEVPFRLVLGNGQVVSAIATVLPAGASAPHH